MLSAQANGVKAPNSQSVYRKHGTAVYKGKYPKVALIGNRKIFPNARQQDDVTMDFPGG